ncbi:hypothetical protein BDV19DRAFT_366397 [Aspergillus venezuelensis]
MTRREPCSLCLSVTASQAWTTEGRRADCHVPLIVSSALPPITRYLKSIANPSRPFHISNILRFGISMVVSAAAWSILLISLKLLSGDSSCEVNASEANLDHFHEGSRQVKN